MDQNNTNLDMQESIGQNQDDNHIVVGQETGQEANIELIQEKINLIKMEDEVKECIVKKYQRITNYYGLHMDTKALKDSLQKYEDDSVKEEFELQVSNLFKVTLANINLLDLYRKSTSKSKWLNLSEMAEWPWSIKWM